jgi:hypothetical protein
VPIIGVNGQRKGELNPLMNLYKARIPYYQSKRFENKASRIALETIAPFCNKKHKSSSRIRIEAPML